MSKDVYTVVRLAINPNHGWAEGLVIDGADYEPNTVIVVEPFTYPETPRSSMVKGQDKIEYPFGGMTRVRHFTSRRVYTDIWALSNGRDLTLDENEAHLLDPDGYFYTTPINVFGAKSDKTADIWPGPSIRCVNLKNKVKVIANVYNAPAEILVYENCAGAEFAIAGSANVVRAHGDRAAVHAKDCTASNLVRMNVTSEGVAFRADRCNVKQNIHGAVSGLKYIADLGVVHMSGRGEIPQGKVNVQLDFIGGVSGGVGEWKDGWFRSGVMFDDFACSSSVGHVMIYDINIGVNIGGGWNHQIDAIRTAGVSRPVVDGPRLNFTKQISAWEIKLPEKRKNSIKEPSSYEGCEWNFDDSRL